jgi:hypothetical protein
MADTIKLVAELKKTAADWKRRAVTAESALAELGFVRAGDAKPPPVEHRAEKGSHSDRADILYGVPAIAKYMGLTTPSCRALCERGDIPTFRMKGRIVCARRKTIDAHLERLASAPAGGARG